MKRWFRFSKVFNYDPYDFPSEGQLCIFAVAACAELKFTSFGPFMSAVANHFKSSHRDRPLPRNTSYLMTVAGLRRTCLKGVKIRRARAISLSILNQLYTVLSPLNWVDIRARALSSIQYSCLLRFSEAVSLVFTDFSADFSTVVIWSSKANLHPVSLRLPPWAISALLSWVTLRRSSRFFSVTQPVFTSLPHSTVSLCLSTWNRFLKSWAVHAKLPASGDPMSSQGFRSGRATDLFMRGHSSVTIKKLGRWSSDSFMIYIRPELISLSRL
jgi:integrase